MLAAVALLQGSVRQLMRLSDLDWTGPVADIQAALGRIRLAKIRPFKRVILFGPLVAFCGCVLVFTQLTRGHPAALDKLDGPWVLYNCGFGFLFVPLGYLTAALARRCRRHPWWQSVLDDISGTTLKSAAHDVDRWARLSRVATPA